MNTNTTTNPNSPVCPDCSVDVHPLEVFPGDRCKACHAATLAGSDPAVEFAQMMRTFRGGGVRRLR